MVRNLSIGRVQLHPYGGSHKSKDTVWAGLLSIGSGEDCFHIHSGCCWVNSLPQNFNSFPCEQQAC